VLRTLVLVFVIGRAYWLNSERVQRYFAASGMENEKILKAWTCSAKSSQNGENGSFANDWMVWGINPGAGDRALLAILETVITDAGGKS
jgi:hypothetical protein